MSRRTDLFIPLLRSFYTDVSEPTTRGFSAALRRFQKPNRLVFLRSGFGSGATQSLAHHSSEALGKVCNLLLRRLYDDSPKSSRASAAAAAADAGRMSSGKTCVDFSAAIARDSSSLLVGSCVEADSRGFGAAAAAGNALFDGVAATFGCCGVVFRLNEM